MIVHDRRFFYKYTTSETALKMLRSRKLKYSSPVLFNDPFDMQTKLDYGFTQLELAEAVNRELERLVIGEEEPTGFDMNPWFHGVMKLREIRQNYPKLWQSELLTPIRKQRIEEHQKRREKTIKEQNAWWGRVVRATRVFCLAEEPDNLLMWAHYAKDHTGVVLEFACLPELDNLIRAAGKVKYVEKPPVIGGLEEYVRYYTGQAASLDHDFFFTDLVLSKSMHWAYEKEWRVVIPPYNMENPTIPRDKNGDEILVEWIDLHPQELSAIYFGCKIQTNARKQIEECLVGDFRHVKRYNAIRNGGQYRLDFVLGNE